MSRRINTVQRTVEAAETEPAKSAETVVATSQPVTPDGPSAEVLIEGSANVLQGTAGTAVVVRIRRGTTTAGAVVGKPVTYQLAAGLNGGIAITVEDKQEGEIASQQYVMTVEATSATGNPKVQGATLSTTF